MKVLLGGWTAWKTSNGTDPNGYPVETGAGGAGGAGQVVTGPGISLITPGSTAPAPNAAPVTTPKP
ncbi:MAG: hypothetical protein M3014_05055 [Chloroflexota bacterium]|nr:hypothetical protein [Chloroflexota bacterium]